MEINSTFTNLWYVHTDGGKVHNSVWTSRQEARERKRILRSAGAKNVTVSLVPIQYGAFMRDNHS